MPRIESKDVIVESHGSVVLVRPQSDEAREWIEEHVDPLAQWFGSALVVEPRYLIQLLEGMAEGGLSI